MIQTNLSDFIKQGKFKDAIKQCRKYPFEASIPLRKNKGSDSIILPLHLFCDLINDAKHQNDSKVFSFGKSLRHEITLLDELMKANPESISRQDEHGRLPIHIACMRRGPYTILKKLVKADKKSLTVKDHEGRTPLAIACKYACCTSTIRMLLKQYPDATLIRDVFGLRPVDLEQRYGDARSDVIWDLKRMMMQASISNQFSKLTEIYPANLLSTATAYSSSSLGNGD